MPETMETLILIKGLGVFKKSDPVIGIARRLSGLWPILSILSLIPRTIPHSCIKSRIQFRALRRKPLPALADPGCWFLDTGRTEKALHLYPESRIQYPASLGLNR